MIYVTGDTHGELSRFTPEAMPGEDRWTKDDILIVTGDFGFLFRGEENDPQEKTGLDILAEKPYTIVFVDGNHEGFPYLNACPDAERYGAPVKLLRPNIFWLLRGNIYTMESKRIFVMGGAYSIDKAFRLSYEAISGDAIWFPEELPSVEEYHRAIRNLLKCEMNVDYILTHTAPRTIIPRVISAMPDDHDAELTGFLDWIYHKANFRRWYFGHFHQDLQVNDQMIACYTAVHRLVD